MQSESSHGSGYSKRKQRDDDSAGTDRQIRRRTSPRSEDLRRQVPRRSTSKHRERKRWASGAEEDYRLTDSYPGERWRGHRIQSRSRDDSQEKRRKLSRRRRPSNSSDGDIRDRHGTYRNSSSPDGMRRDPHRPRDRSRDRDHENEKRHHHRSRSSHRERRERSPRSKRREPSFSISPVRRSRKPLPSQNESFNELTRTGMTPPPNDKPVPKEKPNYNNTGLLARETNLVAGTDIVLKYNEPPEARKPPPSQAWRMFVFKGQDVLDTIELGGKSVWLLGRESKVVDIITAHPSCSGQHAVVQFRHTTKTGKNGEARPGVRPYLLDLESGNGTDLNGQKVESKRFVELRSGDLVKFGNSEREYVIMLPPKED